MLVILPLPAQTKREETQFGLTAVEPSDDGHRLVGHITLHDICDGIDMYMM